MRPLRLVLLALPAAFSAAEESLPQCTCTKYINGANATSKSMCEKPLTSECRLGAHCPGDMRHCTGSGAGPAKSAISHGRCWGKLEHGMCVAFDPPPSPPPPPLPPPFPSWVKCEEWCNEFTYGNKQYCADCLDCDADACRSYKGQAEGGWTAATATATAVTPWGSGRGRGLGGSGGVSPRGQRSRSSWPRVRPPAPGASRSRWWCWAGGRCRRVWIRCAGRAHVPVNTMMHKNDAWLPRRGDWAIVRRRGVVSPLL